MTGLGQFSTHFVLKSMDEAQGIAIGVAAAEEPDHDGEVLDYLESKPYFEKWSATQLANSKGKSYGNVRLQHDDKKPVGLLIKPLQFNDAKRQIVVTAQILDQPTKNLLAAGVLTGFSIGGDYVQKTPLGNGLVKYVADPSELSVCDKPCVPSAVFSLTKADGSKATLGFQDSHHNFPASDQVRGDRSRCFRHHQKSGAFGCRNCRGLGYHAAEKLRNIGRPK